MNNALTADEVAVNKLSSDRNGSRIFALRVQKNLEYLVERARLGEDVHPVTAAVSALLGIVVFPWETSAFDFVKREKLPILKAQGWPAWNMSGPRRVLEVGELLHVLRNSVAHGSIEFDSDSRDPAEVIVTFTNIPEGKTEPDWCGKIRGDNLINFCGRFSRAMRESVA